MRKRLTMALAGGALVAAMAPGLGAAASPDDKVTGSGTSEGSAASADYLHFTVSAHSGPNGEEPRGNIVYRVFDPVNNPIYPGGDVRSADIACMAVDGHDAVVIAEFKDGARPFGPAFPYLALVVRDNGQPSGPDADVALATGANIPGCDALLGAVDFLVVPLVRGNITVRDATP